MALNTLTLVVDDGVQGRRFRSKINGLTAGSEVTLDGDAAPGFSTVNGRLYHQALPYPVNTVAIRERDPATGETKVTRIEIAAATAADLATLAAAQITGGRTLRGYRTAATDDGDGSLVWSIYVEDDLGATVVVAIGAAPGEPLSNHIRDHGDSIREYAFIADKDIIPTLYQSKLDMGGQGELTTALARMGWPALVSDYYDPAALIYAVAGNPQRQSVGDNIAQGGGGIPEWVYQMEFARTRDLAFDADCAAFGTNSTAWTTTATAQKLAFQNALNIRTRYWPDKYCTVATAPPCPARAHVPGMNADIRVMVADAITAGKLFRLDDREIAYTGGTPGVTTQQAGDFLGDTLHPAEAGVGRRGALSAEAALVDSGYVALDTFSPAVLAREISNLGTPGFTGTPGAVSASGITGNLPVGVTAAWESVSGALQCSAVFSVVPHPTDAARRRIKVDITGPAGVQTASARGLVISWTPYSGTAARDQWVASRVRITDNARTQGTEFFVRASLMTVDAADSTKSTSNTVSMRPAGRNRDTTCLLTPDVKIGATSTGVLNRAVLFVDERIAGQTLTVYLDDDNMAYVADPTLTADPDSTIYDTDAAAYFTASGLRHVGVKAAINALVTGLKADGYWSKCDWLTVNANHCLLLSNFNLRNPAKKLTMAQVMDYVPGKGIKGPGVSTATGYVLTYGANEFPNAGGNVFAQDSAHAFVFATEQNAGAEGVQLGTNNNTPLTLIRPATSGSDIYRLNSATQISVANAGGDRTGMRCVTRTSSSTVTAYLNGAQVGQNVASTSADPSAQFLRLNGSSFGGPLLVGNDTIGFSGYGSGLTGGEVAALYARLATCLTAVQAALAS